MTERTCQAEKTPVSIKTPLDLVRKLFEEPGPRCGAPAVRATLFGPMCEECYQRIETGRKNRTNLLGVIEEARERKQ